jgi:hypothetical protein
MLLDPDADLSQLSDAELEALYRYVARELQRKGKLPADILETGDDTSAPEWRPRRCP